MRHSGGRAILVFAVAMLVLGAARDVRAQQFDVTITPNNFTIPAGTSRTVTVSTQTNASTPASATSIVYKLPSILPDFSTSTPTNITTDGPKTTTKTAAPPPNEFPPVTFLVTVPADTPPGSYSGPLTGYYQFAPGNNFTTYQFGVIHFTVTASGPPPDFSVTAAPPAITLAPGGSAQAVFTAAGTNGFSGTINVAAPQLPNVTISPAQFTLSPGQSQAVTFTAAPNAQAGVNTANFGANATVNGTPVNHFVPVTVTVTAPAAQPDFSISVIAAPTQLAPGQSGQLTFTVTPQNGFAGSVSIAAPPLPGLTFSPNPLLMTPGTKAMTITAGAGAQPGVLPLMFTATSAALIHTASATVTITAAPASSPAITSLTPPAVVRGAAPMTLRAAGTNFAAGATIFADSPSIVVLSTTVISPQLADVVVSARKDADLTHPYALRLRNPNGAVTPNGVPLFVVDQDAIGAPLAVRTAAIVSPVEGTLVAGTDAVYPRGLIATSGSGILHGQWRLDGIAYESFDVSATAGMPVEVRGRVKVPLAAWGEHALSLAVATKLEDLATNAPGMAVAPAITIISTIETATRLTLFAPADRAIIGRAIPAFRWSLVPGAAGYRIEFGTADDPAQQTIDTAAAQWTPSRAQLRDLRAIGGIILWRVRAVFPGGVAGEPAPQRAIVVLPEAVALRGTAASGAARWGGGSDGVIYRIDVASDGERLFSAVAVRPEYRVPRFAVRNATALRITPYSPMGEPLGPAVTIALPPANAANVPAATVSNVVVTPANGTAVDTTQPHIAATWSGDAPAGAVTLFIDDTDVTPVSAINGASIAYDSLLPLAPGVHKAKLAIGNTTQLWSFSVAPNAAAPNAPAPAATPALHTDYTLAPNGTITWIRSGKNDAHAQLSSQGDIERPGGAGTKFTGDLAYRGAEDPSSLRQESRNYVVQGNAAAGAANAEAKFGYVTPDVTNGAEFLTSGLARTGINSKLAFGSTTFSYYQPVDTAINGVLSGNDQNLRIRTVGLSTPDGKPFQLRAIALSVDDPDTSELRTIGLFGNWNVSQKLQLTAELARGSVRPDCTGCTTSGRSGNAMRLGFGGVVSTTTYGLVLRHVDADFVNPANRGLTSGGNADRTTADFNLGRQFGLTGFNLTLRRQEAGRSKDSFQPRANQSGANLALNRMFGAHVSASVAAMLSQDRSAAFGNGMPASHRSQDGVNATITETFNGGYSLSEMAGVQRVLDHVNSSSNQTSSTANVTLSGTPVTNLTLSANAGFTRSAGSPVLGTTNQEVVSLQPSLAMPKWFLSLGPRLGYNRSTNDVTHFTSSGAQYAAILQFSPAWAGSLVSGQASAEWNANDSASPSSRSHQLTRRYQASLNVRWGGLHAGSATTTASVLPGAVPPPPPVAQQGPPAASH